MAMVYGIDTGSWRVRVAAMEGSFRRFEIRDAAQVGVPHAEDGTPLMADAIGALRDQEKGWDTAEKAAAFPLDAGVVRLVRLPFVDKNAIARALPAEVEGSVPYDLEDMVLGTRLIDAKDGQSRTSVFIAPKDELRARIDALVAARSEPKLLCMDVDALASYAGRGVQVVVDVGHRRTLLALCQNGQLLGARFVSGGGADLTVAIEDALGVPFARAEEIKHGMALPLSVGEGGADEAQAEWEGEDATDAGLVPPASSIGGAPGLTAEQAALSRAVDLWCAEVRSELITLEDELKVGIDDLLVCGGGAHLEGLGGRLAARTGVPVRPVIVPGGHGIEYALAVALARVAASELKVVDLRTGDLAFHGHAETLWNLVGATVLGGTLAMVAGLTLFAVQLYDANQRLDSLDAKIVDVVTGTFPDVGADRLGEPSMALAIMQERSAETTRRVEALGATVAGVPPTLEMLKSLSEKVPSPNQARIDVRELTISEASITFRAETDSYESAAKIEESLQKDERFKSARKGDEKKVGEALTFTMTIPLGETDAAATGEEG
ncbi:MAG: pilus assembly protein PilM [Pseudomonadota bacterium]|nr:pilus assembly protein PilM [Pseudomonadota bacterium]